MCLLLLSFFVRICRLKMGECMYMLAAGVCLLYVEIVIYSTCPAGSIAIVSERVGVYVLIMLLLFVQNRHDAVDCPANFEVTCFSSGLLRSFASFCRCRLTFVRRLLIFHLASGSLFSSLPKHHLDCMFYID